MQMKLTPKSILIITIALVLVVSFIVLKKPFAKRTHTTDQAAVVACQKQVETTYTTLLDSASLTAPATTGAIQKQEQDAKNTCVTNNTH